MEIALDMSFHHLEKFK